MGKKQTIAQQAKGRLLRLQHYGDKKHEDKKNNNGKPAMEKIYSIKTMDNYIGAAQRFARWASAEHGCRNIDDARPYATEYLSKRTEEGKSAWTVHLDAAAIAKMYQCHMEELAPKLPTRSLNDITQHRTEAWRGHFDETKHSDLVDLCKSCGLRRHELAALKPEDVRLGPDGCAQVHVVRGKGGKERWIHALDSKPYEAARAAQEAGRELVVEHIPKYAPIHEYRAQYARSYYESIARDVTELPEKETYICRGDRAGQVYDRAAMLETSHQLGHGRLDVMMHYLK